jgi:hypothetical protein
MKKEKKKTVEMKWDPDHSKPVTRRQFMAQGLASGLAISMTPSILYSMFRSEIAAAQTASCNPIANPANLIPLIVQDMVGGISLSSNFLVKDAGGAYLSSYSFLGIPSGNHPNSASNQVDSSFGAPMHATLSRFLAGMKSVMSPEAMANTRIMTVCHTAQDDTNVNPLSPLILATKAGLEGSVLKQGLGNFSGPAGGNSSSPALDAAYKPIIVNSGDTLVKALKMGEALNANTFNVAAKLKIANAAKNLSTGQLARFQNMDQGSQFRTLLETGYTKNLDLISCADSLNASANPNVTSIYGNEATSAKASVVFNALQGFTGPGAYAITGCDYHGRTQAESDAKDFEAGMELGRVLELAKRLGKPVAVAGISDGAIAFASGTRTPQSDAGVKSMSFLACYKPSGPPAMTRNQIGAYTQGQGVDMSSAFFFAQSPTAVANILFANYLKLSNRMDLLAANMTSGTITDAQLPGILGFA